MNGFIFLYLMFCLVIAVKSYYEIVAPSYSRFKAKYSDALFSKYPTLTKGFMTLVFTIIAPITVFSLTSETKIKFLRAASYKGLEDGYLDK